MNRPRTALLLLAAIGLIQALAAAERIEGSVVQTVRGRQLTMGFDLLRDGPRYLLKLSRSENALAPWRTKDGMEVPWFEIGSDGTSLHVVRQIDSALLKTGALMTAHVLPGRTILREIPDAFPIESSAQAIFIAFLASGLDSLQELFPTSLIDGETDRRLSTMRMTLVPDPETGLPADLTFRTAGDFPLIRFEVLERSKVGGVSLPSRAVLRRFLPPAAGSSPRVGNEYRITVALATVVPSPPPADILPRLAPDAQILDNRPGFRRFDGKPQRSAGRDGWPTSRPAAATQ